MAISSRRGGAAADFRAALAERVVVADGAMGTMLQGSSAAISDFGGHEGCSEILNVTRPDLVRSVHDGYLDAGVDVITTNTFGANLGNLGEYGIGHRIGELSEAGARIARAAAGVWCTVLRAQPGRPGSAELGVPGRVRAGRAGLRDRAPVPDHADRPHPR